MALPILFERKFPLRLLNLMGEERRRWYLQRRHPQSTALHLPLEPKLLERRLLLLGERACTEEELLLELFAGLPGTTTVLLPDSRSLRPTSRQVLRPYAREQLLIGSTLFRTLEQEILAGGIQTILCLDPVPRLQELQLMVLSGASVRIGFDTPRLFPFLNLLLKQEEPATCSRCELLRGLLAPVR
jgi:hypothetical protein